jgi:hypothetical protein
VADANPLDNRVWFVAQVFPLWLAEVSPSGVVRVGVVVGWSPQPDGRRQPVPMVAWQRADNHQLQAIGDATSSPVFMGETRAAALAAAEALVRERS